MLKKKFDDIFAATKYTKALETIRKLKNELAGELKEKKADHNLLKERQETAATLKKQVANATQRKGDIEERIRKAQEREQELDAELGQLHAKAAKIRGIADQIKARAMWSQSAWAGPRARLRVRLARVRLALFPGQGVGRASH